MDGDGVDGDGDCCDGEGVGGEGIDGDGCDDGNGVDDDCCDNGIVSFFDEDESPFTFSPQVSSNNDVTLDLDLVKYILPSSSLLSNDKDATPIVVGRHSLSSPIPGSS